MHNLLKETPGSFWDPRCHKTSELCEFDTHHMVGHSVCFKYPNLKERCMDVLQNLVRFIPIVVWSNLPQVFSRTFIHHSIYLFSLCHLRLSIYVIEENKGTSCMTLLTRSIERPVPSVFLLNTHSVVLPRSKYHSHRLIEIWESV